MSKTASGRSPAQPPELDADQALALRTLTEASRRSAIVRGLRWAAVAMLGLVALAAVVAISITVVRSLRGLDGHLQSYDGQARASGSDEDPEHAPLRGASAPKDEP